MAEVGVEDETNLPFASVVMIMFAPVYERESEDVAVKVPAIKLPTEVEEK